MSKRDKLSHSLEIPKRIQKKRSNTGHKFFNIRINSKSPENITSMTANFKEVYNYNNLNLKMTLKTTKMSDDMTRNIGMKNRLYAIPNRYCTNSGHYQDVPVSNTQKLTSMRSKYARKLLPIANFSKMVKENTSFADQSYLDNLVKQLQI